MKKFNRASLNDSQRKISICDEDNEIEISTDEQVEKSNEVISFNDLELWEFEF
jgi:hypothetical protein